MFENTFHTSKILNQISNKPLNKYFINIIYWLSNLFSEMLWNDLQRKKLKLFFFKLSLFRTVSRVHIFVLLCSFLYKNVFWRQTYTWKCSVIAFTIFFRHLNCLVPFQPSETCDVKTCHQGHTCDSEMSTCVLTGIYCISFHFAVVNFIVCSHWRHRYVSFKVHIHEIGLM